MEWNIPLVYCVLEDKTEVSYKKCFQIIKQQFEKFSVEVTVPQIIMSDFKVAILNAIKAEEGDNSKACLFYLGQSIFRRVQAKGIQQAYCDKDDTSIKKAI